MPSRIPGNASILSEFDNRHLVERVRSLKQIVGRAKDATIDGFEKQATALRKEADAIGWLRHWGQRHLTTDHKTELENKASLAQKYSRSTAECARQEVIEFLVDGCDTLWPHAERPLRMEPQVGSKFPLGLDVAVAALELPEPDGRRLVRLAEAYMTLRENEIFTLTHRTEKRATRAETADAAHDTQASSGPEIIKLVEKQLGNVSDCIEAQTGRVEIYNYSFKSRPGMPAERGSSLREGLRAPGRKATRFGRLTNGDEPEGISQ